MPLTQRIPRATRCIAAASSVSWRAAVVLLVAALAAMLLPASPGGAAQASDQVARAAEVEEAVADAIDAERAAIGVPPLAHLDEMDEVAREFAAQLGREGGLRHNREVLPQLDARGVHAEVVSEIVGWSTVRASVEEEAEALLQGWGESGAHRARIEDPDRTHAGVGAAYAEGRVYVVAMFARDALRPAVRAALDDDAVTGAEHAVLGRSDDPADILAAGPLVGDDGVIAFADPPRGSDDPGPLLPEGVVERLDGALVDGATVYVVGGPAAVGTRVEDELVAAGFEVRRLAGADRTETAAEIAREVVARDGDPDEVVIAGAHDWPDAVGGGLWAAVEGAPVLLSRRDGLPEATADVLADLPAAERVVVGGEAVVGEGVVETLGARRVAGPDRYATSSAAIDELFDGDPEALLLALGHGAGEVWGHPLGLTRLAAEEEAALLLVHPDRGLPDSAVRQLSARDGDPPRVLLAEGVDPALADEVEALAGP